MERIPPHPFLKRRQYSFFMKKRSLIIICLLAGLITGSADLSAQQEPPRQYSIFDALQSSVPGKGTVVIDQPVAIRRMVGLVGSGADVETRNGSSYMKVQGYRIQVFSGNDQRTAKDEAFRKEKAIKEVFPNLATYVIYVAPFWRLRVGDYNSYEEAYYMRRQLMQAFPSYGKEMYPVKEDVRIRLDSFY